MTNPPKTIDGAKVLQVASLEGSAPTGQTRHSVNGQDVSAFAALAMAKYPDDPGIYLFYCDEAWTTMTDTYHDDLEHAIGQAEFEFGPLQFVRVGGIGVLSLVDLCGGESPFGRVLATSSLLNGRTFADGGDMSIKPAKRRNATPTMRRWKTDRSRSTEPRGDG